LRFLYGFTGQFYPDKNPTKPQKANRLDAALPFHIFLLVGYDAAHSTLGVFHITLISWNHVDMDMWHRLTRCRTDINTDIVTIRVVLLIDDAFHFIDQFPDSRFFFSRGLKVFSNMPARNDQAMARARRVTVIVGIRQLIFDDNFRIPAKGTILMFAVILIKYNIRQVVSRIIVIQTFFFNE